MGLKKSLGAFVTGVVGRAELLSSIFFLAAFAAYMRCTRSTNRLRGILGMQTFFLSGFVSSTFGRAFCVDKFLLFFAFVQEQLSLQRKESQNLEDDVKLINLCFVGKNGSQFLRSGDELEKCVWHEGELGACLSR
ncbi:unnamed protein product [Notodromas monacha]|uniref:Uncharacterized protein n=1 Tax=Notodromas monacha TaxID=399045 RepID=A0A7R9GDM6_9CRUS|nr:unnamed protein product [Notodromas monacha]CAG0918848.1 unnamed protein product [Notodromas monacha]